MSFPKWPDARITSMVIFLYLCIYVCVIFFLTLCFCLIFMIISLHYFSFHIHYNNAKYVVSPNLLEKFFQVFIWSFLRFYQLSAFVLLISLPIISLQSHSIFSSLLLISLSFNASSHFHFVRSKGAIQVSLAWVCPRLYSYVTEICYVYAWRKTTNHTWPIFAITCRFPFTTTMQSN